MAAQTPGAVAARVGEQFHVRLESNPTTGYRWRLAGAPDAGVAALVASTFEPGDGDLTGAGGEEVWTFAARGAGRTRIVLEYVRPWETDERPLRTHTLEVTVRPRDGG